MWMMSKMWLMSKKKRKALALKKKLVEPKDNNAASELHKEYSQSISDVKHRDFVKRIADCRYYYEEMNVFHRKRKYENIPQEITAEAYKVLENQRIVCENDKYCEKYVTIGEEKYVLFQECNKKSKKPKLRMYRLMEK